MRRTDSTNLLGRLDLARPAYTITTQFNNVTCGCYTHPTEDRPLSVREGARLQSFPDRYRFAGSLTSRCRQIGNAVPPLLAQHLACALAQSLGDAPPTRPPNMVRSDVIKAAPPSEVSRARMRAQPRVSTAPEALLRAALSERGISFSINVRPVAGVRREADILIEHARLAVMVDGCFWHGCPVHSRPTKSNTKWWRTKIDANKARDEETDEILRRHGVQVIRVWEHEDPQQAADRIEDAIRRDGRSVRRTVAASDPTLEPPATTHGATADV